MPEAPVPPQTPPKIFDRDRVRQHLLRRPADRDDFVTRMVLADLAERLSTVTRTFEQAIIISPDASGMPTEGASAEAPFSFARASTVLAGPHVPLVDPEALDLPGRGYDLIVSVFDLDVVDDVPGFLARARAHLRGDGLFLAAAIGGDSLTELREAWLDADSQSGSAFLRVAPFISLQQSAGLLQRAGFALPVSDVESHTVRYGSLLRLMQELRALGASNPLAERPDRFVSRSLLGTAAASYERLAADADGRLRATLEIIWMSGWAPHSSQQKPLKPGSAKMRLADALKVS